jgi:hypothetical protein
MPGRDQQVAKVVEDILDDAKEAAQKQPPVATPLLHFPVNATKQPRRKCDTDGVFAWWAERGSNPRPLRCERSALTG